MLIARENSMLVIIDVQEKLVPAVQDSGDVIRNINILSAAADILGVPVLISEHCPDALGPTDPQLSSVPENVEKIIKTHFSAVKEAGGIDQIEKLGRKQIVVCGMETHVCVLQTCLDLLAAGFDVFLVTDATSSRKLASKNSALERLSTNGGEGVTAEMVVFEWVEDARIPEFKNILSLIK